MFQQLRREFYVDWKTQRFIGQGGFGTCYLVQYRDENGKMRECVIKILRVEKRTEEDQAAFDREEYHMMNLNEHRNLIHYIGSGIFVNEQNLTQRGILMEYCAKGSLKEILLNPQIYYPAYKFICWASDLFDALDYLKRKGAIHLDLKPENILATQDYVVKIADFGSMKSQPMEQGILWNGYSPPRATTQHYQSPELYGELTSKYDVFAMGLVLWELIERRTKDWSSVGPTFLIVPESCPEEIQKIVINCTRQEPQERWDASIAKNEVEKVKQEHEGRLFVERDVSEPTGHRKARKPFDSNEEDDEVVIPDAASIKSSDS